MRSGKLVIAEGGPAAMIDQSLADAVLEAQPEVAVQVSSIGAACMVRAHRSYSVDLPSSRAVKNR